MSSVSNKIDSKDWGKIIKEINASSLQVSSTKMMK